MGTISEDDPDVESILDKYLGTWGYGEYIEESNSIEIITEDKIYLINVDTFDVSIKEEEEEVKSLNGMYSVADLTEDDIAPADLFLYGDLDDTNMTVTITGIDGKYCNGGEVGVSYDDDSYVGTNYDIIYNDTKISDTLVIPYKYEKDGKEYTVTAVNVTGQSIYKMYPIGRIPNVKTIIYPNTVTEVFHCEYTNTTNSTLKKVVLSNQLQKIGSNTFAGCYNLTEIKLPDTLTSIGNYTFKDCNRITKITIPENVVSVGYNVFEKWTSSQTIIIKGSTTGWDRYWKDSCNANIQY